ncbi:N-acetylneuraminate synthase [Bacillus sp. AK128]
MTKLGFYLGDYLIDQNSKVFVIAEAGVNHNGDMSLAKRLVDVAYEAGANAVKFQSFITKNLITDNAPKANYQLVTTNQNETQFEMLKKLELSSEDQRELKRYCEVKGILFLSTPFDEDSFELLETLGVQAYKISSTDCTNLLFLRNVAKTQKPIILSTGMTSYEELKKAINVIRYQGNEQLVVMHCTANYPALPTDCNIRAIETISKDFNVLTGYSDHTPGIGIAPFTVPLGVKVIEKHFTLDKTMEGPDHRASLDPIELKELIQQIRYVESALGNGEKVSVKSEVETKEKLQKKLFAKVSIQKGQTIKEEMLTAKRSAIGLSAIYGLEIIDTKAKEDILEGAAITISAVDLQRDAL